MDDGESFIDKIFAKQVRANSISYWNCFLTMDMQLAISQEDPQTDESIAAGW